ncbi:MAG: magnesium-translocating P-type ATPase [Thaumarchaeota archaeon]|nr:magnesium-translocating P-type ATPase [Nitrososphaerota archaeon]
MSKPDDPSQPSFWSVPASDTLQRLQTTSRGLTDDEAGKRLKQYGTNLLKPKKRSDAPTLLLAQFKSPVILILIFAGGLSFFLGDPVNALIILVIILVSSLLGFSQERGANKAVEKLLAIVQTKATVIRDGTQKDIPVEGIVPGDIVVLNAGDLIPGDSLVIESKDLFVNEASLTGETYPAEKTAGVLPPETALSQRTNSLFMGTNVVSGSAQAVVVGTGARTEFGKVSERLKLRPPETEFEHGVRRFGYLLMEVTMLLVVATFAINVYFARPVLDSLLFSLALAVGLTPQLLPAIISINLAQGAKKMALQKVIVKRLASIENFGSMNVFCSDKTGTLTEGSIKIQSVLDVQGKESEKVLLYAFLNAFFQSGFTNPIDEAIRSDAAIQAHHFDASAYKKLDEVPYDFLRKRLSVLVSKDEKNLMVTKGALQNVLDVCSSVETSEGTTAEIAEVQKQIQQQFEDFSSKGFRVLGIAYKDIGTDKLITKDSEVGMTFLGFIVLYDPIKPKIAETINDLKVLGISLKIITGDNRLVAGVVSQQVGFPTPRIIAGPELLKMSDEALLGKVNQTDVFAEVEPNQKERIILAFKKAGNVVGYMGDGINDASALHAADVGISVESAVDVAKESASIVLRERDLGVLVQGVKEGRKTFANTLKYVFMATSSNFGNMFSMAGASLFLPFLPLLPRQILLTNLMTDFPEITIGTDNVDSEMVEQPRRWNVSFIRNFMITFGILSSVFDYLTFGVLLLVLNSSTVLFRTGWFVESVVSATLIVLVIRSRRPFFKSVPGTHLVIATIAVLAATIVLPFTLIGDLFGFGPPPILFIVAMAAIVMLYIISGEVAKRIFYKRAKF